MKKQAFLWVLSLCSMLHIAIGQDTTHTLLKLRMPKNLGLYIAPEYQFGQIGGSFTHVGGVSAMLLIDKRLAMGLTASMGLDRNFVPTQVAPLYLSSRFEGVRLEYTLSPDAAIHISIPLTVGMGSVSLDSFPSRNGGHQYEYYGTQSGNRKEKYEQFIIQPGINVEGNLIRFAKVFVGASYRISLNTSNTSITPISTNTLQGFSLNIGMKLGLFDFSLKKKEKKPL